MNELKPTFRIQVVNMPDEINGDDLAELRQFVMAAYTAGYTLIEHHDLYALNCVLLIFKVADERTA